MEADTRVTTLNSKHSYLEHAIDEEAHRPSPDYVRITELKRKKLRIKDEIARITEH